MSSLLDDGCRVHPHCLTCPLPVCIFELPKNWLRDSEIRRCRWQGVETLAQRFGLSRRRIFAVLAQREEVAA